MRDWACPASIGFIDKMDKVPTVSAELNNGRDLVNGKTKMAKSANSEKIQKITRQINIYSCVFFGVLVVSFHRINRIVVNRRFRQAGYNCATQIMELFI